MAWPYDDEEEEQDPLVIDEQPRPTGAVIEQANLQEAPEVAPTPTVKVDAYARGTPAMDKQGVQATPASLPQPPPPKFVPPPSQDAYTPKSIPPPVLMHYQSMDPDEEDRIQAEQQRQAHEVQATAQKEEEKRATKTLRGLKGQGVEIVTDPDGTQKPKVDDHGRMIFKPSVLSPFEDRGNGNLVSVHRDRFGNEQDVPLKPKIDKATGEKYVVSADGVSRMNLGVDEDYVLRRDATMAGKLAAQSRAELNAIAQQKKDLSTQIEDFGGKGALIASKKNLTDDDRLALKQIQTDRQKAVDQLKQVDTIHGEKAKETEAFTADFLGRRKLITDKIAQKLGVPAPSGVPEQPAATPTPPPSNPKQLGETLDKAKADPVGFKQRAGEIWKNAEFVPYVGTGVEIKQLVDLGLAGKRMLDAAKQGKTGSVEDAKLVAEYLKRANRDESGWAKVAGFLGQSISFGGELAIAAFTLGGGLAATAGTRGTAKVAKMGLAKLAEKGARELLTTQIEKVLGKNVVTEITGKVAGKVAEAAVLTPVASALRITAGTLERTMPAKFSKDQAGKITAMANDEADGFVQAIGKASLDSYIENLSEFSGGIFKYAPGAKKIASLKGAILAKLGAEGKLGPLAEKLRTATSTLSKAAAWNGALSEVGEEYIGGAMHAAVGQGTLQEQLPGVDTLMKEGPGAALRKDILPMVAAFMIPGAASNFSAATTNWMEKITSGQKVDKLSPQEEADILNDLHEAGVIDQAPPDQATVDQRTGEVAVMRQDLANEIAMLQAEIEDPEVAADVKSEAIQRVAAIEEELSQLPQIETQQPTPQNEEGLPTPRTDGAQPAEPAPGGEPGNRLIPDQAQTEPEIRAGPEGQEPQLRQGQAPAEGDAPDLQSEPELLAPAEFREEAKRLGLRYDGPMSAGGTTVHTFSDTQTGAGVSVKGGANPMQLHAKVMQARAKRTQDKTSGAETIADAFSQMGKGVTENFYEKAFEALEKGETRISGVKDPVLSKAKPAFDAGKIKSADDLRKFLSEKQAPTVDDSAHEAATSQKNDRPAPSMAQHEAGNAKLGHHRIGGLDMSFENPEGSIRTNVSLTDVEELTDPTNVMGGAGSANMAKNLLEAHKAGNEKGVQHYARMLQSTGAEIVKGEPWATKMQAHYGYIKRTEGKDGDHVDAYVKPGTPDDWSGRVYVFNQHRPNGDFDEHKVILGAKSAGDALDILRAHVPPGWKLGPNMVGMEMDEFKQWLENGDMTKPAPKGKYGDQKQKTTEVPVQETSETGETKGQERPGVSGATGGEREGRLRDKARAKKLVQEGLLAKRGDLPPVKASLDALGVEFDHVDSGGDFSMLAAYRIKDDGTPRFVLKIDQDRIGATLTGLSDKEAGAIIENALTEEMIHFAGLEAVRRDWEAGGRKGTFKEAVDAEYKGIAAAMNDTEKADTQAAYETRQLGEVEMGAEFLRQLLQQKRTGTVTEATMRARPIIDRLLAVLKSVWENIKTRSEALRKAIERTEAVLTEIDAGAKPKAEKRTLLNKPPPGGWRPEDKVPRKPPTPQVPPMPGMTPLGMKKPKAPPADTTKTQITSGASDELKEQAKKAFEGLFAPEMSLPDFIDEGHPLAGKLKQVGGKGETAFDRHAAQKLLDEGRGVYSTLPDGEELVRIKSSADFGKYNDELYVLDADETGFQHATPTEQKPFPKEKRAAFLDLADKLEAEGITTPEKVGALLDEISGGKLRPYSQALWAMMESTGAVQRKEIDWPAVYSTLEASNEPANAPNQPPAGGDIRPMGEPSGEGDQGERAGVGERDTEADAGVLEGPTPADVGATPENGPGGKIRAGTRGTGRASDKEEPANGDESGGRERGTGEGLLPDGTRSGRTDGDRDSEPVGPRSSRGNYYLAEPEKIQGGGPKARFSRNRKAIETYQELVAANREPTKDELDTIAGFMGWGSFGQELFQGNWQHPMPKPEWKEESKWLREHMGQKEWESSQRSIINAHYTDPPTVTAIWDMIRNMGFKGGRVLEPSMGVGNFFGLMPRDLMAKSALTGIEMDHITAGMASMLYPDANIQAKGYQDSKTSDDFYDLIIGNWPFSAKKGFADRRYEDLDPTLHDYFFIKALDQVRPGGLVVGITSSGTMDKKGGLSRLAMAKKAELVASFRLPSGTFGNYAGTKVVTDLIILRKRTEVAKDAHESAGWLKLVDVETRSGTKVAVNEYYAQNPTHVLGELNFGHGTTRGQAGMIVEMPADFAEKLAALPKRVPGGAYKERAKADATKYITNNTGDRQGAVVEVKAGGAEAPGFYVVRGDHLASLDDVVKYRLKSDTATEKRELQLSKIIELRRSLGKLIDAERDGKPEVEKLRLTLRNQFNSFRQKHGNINDSDALTILRKAGDPFWTSIASLERNVGTRDEPKWEGTAILTRSTMRGKKSLENPSVEDAYVQHRNETMDIQPARIAELSKTPVAEVIKKLTADGAILQTPQGNWEPREMYLSGNVRRKMREAEDAKAQGQDMERNIEALKTVMPKDTPYFNIEARLGNTWTTSGDYADFIGELLNTGDNKKDIDVAYGVQGWKVKLSDFLNGKTEAIATWGIDERRQMPFHRLLTLAMNNQSATIWRRDSDGNRYVDDDATQQANAKIERLREEFQNWIWKEPMRRVRLEKSFNEIMNAVANPSWDGSFLTFEGMALERGDSQFGLRGHQANGIWRGVVLGRGIYAHEVGTGKTYTIAGICVESRRYGVAQKPLVFAHNANSATVAREINEMYPAAKVLYIENLDPESRERTLAQISTDDWDAIVVPHSLMDRFTLKPETLQGIAAEQIAELEAAAIEAAEDDNVSLDVAMMDDPDQMKHVRSATAKELVKQRQKIIEKIEQAALKAQEGAVFFEDLGVDMILVDEAHEFKKPPIASKMQVRGLNKQGSGRSINLFFLTEYLHRQNNGKGVHLFTGTPITNTLNEIYNMQRYVMSDVLKRDGIAKWDSWFATFADTVTDAELAPTGEYESITRLSSFINVAELRRIIGEYMDVVFADDMPEMKPRPTQSGKTLHDKNLTEEEKRELLNGRNENPEGRPYKKIITEVAEMSPDQKRIRIELARRAAVFRDADKKSRREMILSGSQEVPVRVETDAANVGLDARLFDHRLGDSDTSKANRMVERVMHHYQNEDRASQVIFMERGYSDVRMKSQGRNAAGEKLPKLKVQGFNLAKEIVEKLIKAGIPSDQIAIVDGSVSKQKRKEIADKMNTGEIRVVIGNTQTLGTGVNMQKNLRALHHLDAPWRPGDLEQRNGRGWRQGNEWNTVLEYRYISEGIDGRRWQVLKIKDQFIKAFLKADENTRVIEGDSVSMDEGESIGDIAETFAKAAGDPRLIIQAKLRKEVERLNNKERIHTRGIAEAQFQLQKLLEDRAENKIAVEHFKADAETYQAHAEEPFSVTLDDATIDKRKDADEVLDGLSTTFKASKNPVTLGTYKGFTLQGKSDFVGDPVILIKGADVYRANVSFASIDATLRNLRDKGTRLAEEVDRSLIAEEGIRKMIATPFGRADELEKKKAMLSGLEKDIEMYPVPAPAWLREGAPIDTEVYVEGQKRFVRGHRWSRTNWFVLLEGEKGLDPTIYTAVNDENNLPIYEPRKFEEPLVSSTASKLQTPNGLKVGMTVERLGGFGDFYGKFKVTDIVPPKDEKSTSAKQWTVQIEGLKDGKTDIVTADQLQLLAAETEAPKEPEGGGLQAPEPSDDPRKTALKSAYAELPKTEQLVLSMKLANKSNEDIAVQAKLTPQAVETAYNIALRKMQKASTAAQTIREVFTQAKSEPAGARTIGRPELANPAAGERSRQFVDTVDEIRKRSGVPYRRKDKDVIKDARERLKKNYTAERRALIEKATRGELLDDVETVMAKKIVAREALRSVRSGTNDGMLEGAKLIDAYRMTGTAAGRALRQRFDPYMTPEERASEYIAQAMLTPDRGRVDRMKRLADEIEQLESELEKADSVTAEKLLADDIEKKLEERERILENWMEKVAGIKKKLAKMGIDLDTMDDEQIATVLKDKVKVAKAVRAIAAAKADNWDKAYEYWISAILSHPLTQVANLVGNVGHATWEFTVQRFAEALINQVPGIKNPKSAQFGEFKHMLRAVMPGLQRASRNFMMSWRTEMPVFEEEVTGRQGHEKIPGTRGAIGGTAGRTVRTPLRTLLAVDEYCKSIFGQLQAAAMAYRIAKMEKLSGDELDQRVAQLLRTDSEQPSEAWMAGRTEAVRLAFQEEMGSMGNAVINFRNQFPGMRYELPFVHTLAKIFTVGIRKTPLGSAALLYRIGREGLIKMRVLQHGDWQYARTDFVRHFSEQLLAWGITMSLLSSLTAPDDDDGLPQMTGTVPYKGTKRGERDLAYRTAPPMSIKIGSKWYSYARIEPFATSFAVTIDLLNEARRVKNGEDWSTALGKVLTHLLAVIKDKTFARGIGDVLNAIEDGDSMVEWAGNFSTSWVPNIIKGTVRETDTTVREQKAWGRGEEWFDNFVDSMKYKATGYAGEVIQPKIDLWGRQIDKDKGISPATDWLWRMTTPSRTEPTGHVLDVDRLILNWNNAHPERVFAPQPPPPYWTKTIEGKPRQIFMDREEYRQFLEMAGASALGRIQVMSLNYANPTQKDVEAIEKSLAKARKDARDQLWKQRLTKKASGS